MARRLTLLTHWGLVTHICVGKLTIIGSDYGLSPGRRQAIIWTNDGILLIGPLGTNFSEIPWRPNSWLQGISTCNIEHTIMCYVFLLPQYPDHLSRYMCREPLYQWLEAGDIINDLTHLTLDKMDAIPQIIFSDAFSWMKRFVFWLKFHWSLFLRVQLTISQHWFRQWLVPK